LQLEISPCGKSASCKTQSELLDFFQNHPLLLYISNFYLDASDSHDPFKEQLTSFALPISQNFQQKKELAIQPVAVVKKYSFSEAS
jgi:hypothetical protein